MLALLHFLALIIRCSPAFSEAKLRKSLSSWRFDDNSPHPTRRNQSRRSRHWIALFRFWPRWKRVLFIVKPDTVVRWHRRRFRVYRS